ncbi:hypothetical protein GGR98_002627 [Parageobacillus caldoxylosilyticus]|nr:hypothetical protein [Parageobacillus caldoxylosilyticus]
MIHSLSRFKMGIFAFCIPWSGKSAKKRWAPYSHFTTFRQRVGFFSIVVKLVKGKLRYRMSIYIHAIY